MGRKGKRIKILYTIPNFDTAGSGRVLYDLAKGLDPNKFDISIACRHNRGSFFKEIDSLGPRVRGTGRWSETARDGKPAF